MRALVSVLILSGSCWAGEYAVLTSGARLPADRHENSAGMVRLYLGNGFTELPQTAIAAFETDDYPSPPAAAPAVSAGPAKAVDVKQLVDAAAARWGLPPALVHSVVAAESGYRADAVSPKGAIGLMQLMPSTAKALGADPRNPEQNVDAGTRYLRDLLLKYHNGLWHALAAYNAGPGAVQKYNGIPPYRETIAYINRITRRTRLNTTSKNATD
jgi:soluble lytic murein transglycosylase-like protein